MTDFTYQEGTGLTWAQMNENLRLMQAKYLDSANSAAIAMAAANFKGAWAGLTGSLPAGSSVYHSSKFWLLLSNLADVTAATPGVSASWLQVNTGNVQGPTGATAGNVAVLDATGKALSDGGIAPAALMPKAGGDFTGSVSVSRQTSTSIFDYAIHIKSSSGTSNAGRFLISQGATYGLAYAPNSTGSTGAFMDLQWVDIATGAVQSMPLRIRYSGLLETPGILASGSLGIGYMTGAGGSVSQATSRTTGVTLNKPAGQITLVSAAGSASWQSFTLTNSVIKKEDGVIVTQRTGTDLYEIHVTAKADGSCRISFRTTGGTTTEQPVFDFQVIKGATS